MSENNPLKGRTKWRYSFILLIVVFITYSFYLTIAPSYIDIDPTIYAEPSYNLAFRGILAAPSYDSFLNFDQFVYKTSSFWFLFQASFFMVFGFGFVQMYFLPFILSMATLLMTYYFAKRFFGRKIAYISLILLTTNILYLIISVSNRPDMSVAFFNTAAFFAFCLSREREKYIYLAGFLSALGALSHPNGIAVFIGMVFYLIIKKEKTKLPKLIVPFIIPFIPFIYYINLDFDTFVEQTDWDSGGGIYRPFSGEGERFLRLFTFAPFYGIIMLISLFYSIRRWKEDGYKLYSVILMTFIAFIIFVNPLPWNIKYFGTVAPIVSVFAASFFNRKIKTINIYTVLIILTIGVGLASTTLYFVTNLPGESNPGVAEISTELSGIDDRIIAARNMFVYFPEGNMRNIRSFKELAGNGTPMKLIEEYNADYIIIDIFFRQRLDSMLRPYKDDFDQYLQEGYTKVKTIEKRWFNIRAQFAFQSFLVPENYDIDIYKRNQ